MSLDCHGLGRVVAVAVEGSRLAGGVGWRYLRWSWGLWDGGRIGRR